MAFVIFRASVVKLLQQSQLEPPALSTPAHVAVSVIMLYSCMGLVLMLTALGFSKGMSCLQ